MFTRDQVIEKLEEVVAEVGPDFVYPERPSAAGVDCYYVWNGQPDCIVGRVLHRLGVSLDDLARFEGRGINAVNAELDILDEEALHVLNRAQEVQDTPKPYGLALAFAKDPSVDVWAED